MKKLLLTTLALGLLSLPALAGDKAPEQLREESSIIAAHDGLQRHKFTRIVPSNKEQRVFFAHQVHPDCSSVGEAVIRITKEPEHGKVRVTPTTDYAGYPKENIRYKCNQHKVQGQQITYKSEDKYTGDDTVEALVIFQNGFAWEVSIDVMVR